MGLRSLLSGLTALWCLLAAPADAADANLTVDLEYGVYTGVLNTATRLNVWRGIRYAAAPVGKLRWQAPQTPATDRTVVVANAFGPTCPQSFPSFPTTANTFVAGNEDCLNLNVYSPVRSTDALLPVMVWIHGGGYGLGDGKQDLSAFINTNDNALVAVAIQYRVCLGPYLGEALLTCDIAS
jgi:carboxylesterase type B